MTPKKRFVRLLNKKLMHKAFATVASAILVTSCGSRPGEVVLKPFRASHAPTLPVTLIAITNRTTSPSRIGFEGKWANELTFERYQFSIPQNRNGTKIAYPLNKPDLRDEYFVSRREKFAQNIFASAVTTDAGFDGTVAVFVHGYNSSFQEALYRTAQMTADVSSNSSSVLFSWPSAASVMGYVADRDAAMYSRSELANVLVALGEAPKVKNIILLGHSMGGFLSMEAVRQLKLKGDKKTTGKLQVILASPDIDVDVFRSQIIDIGRLVTPITLLVSKSDRALMVSSLLAGERERVGKVDIDDPVVIAAAKADRLRVIDISALKSVDGLGHDRFATFARFGGTLVRDETRNIERYENVGASVFDAAGSVVATPFRMAGEIIRQQKSSINR